MSGKRPVYGRRVSSARKKRREQDAPLPIVRTVLFVGLLAFACLLRFSDAQTFVQLRDTLGQVLQQDVDYQDAVTVFAQSITGQTEPAPDGESAITVFGKQILGLPEDEQQQSAPPDQDPEPQEPTAQAVPNADNIAQALHALTTMQQTGAGESASGSQPLPQLPYSVTPLAVTQQEDTTRQSLYLSTDMGAYVPLYGIPVMEAPLPGYMPVFGTTAVESALPGLEPAVMAGLFWPDPNLSPENPFSGQVVPEIVDTVHRLLPFSYQMPVEGELSSDFGYRIHPISGEVSFHYGMDYAAPSGTDIVSFADGAVDEVGYSSIYGNYIRVTHDDGFSSFYGHLKDTDVSEGDAVGLGDVIGGVGSTGYSTGPHLHFELWKDARVLDVSNYL